MLIEQESRLNFDPSGALQLESYGKGTYVVQSYGEGLFKVADGTKSLVGNVGYGTLKVLSDGKFLCYAAQYEGFGLNARVYDANGNLLSEVSNYSPTGNNFDIRGAQLVGLDDGRIFMGETDTQNANQPVSISYPYNNSNYTTGATTGRGTDVGYFFFNGDLSNPTGGIANTGGYTFNGASTQYTFNGQRVDGVLKLANGSVVESYADLIAIGNPAERGGGYVNQSVINMRIVSPTGTVSDNIQVNTDAYSTDIFNPATYRADGRDGEQLVSLGDKGFAVIWHEQSRVPDASVYGGYRFDGTDTKIRYFDLSGNALTDEVQLIHRSADLGNLAAFVGADSLGDGRIAISFQDGVYGANGSAAGQLFVSVVGELGTSIDTTAITPPAVQGRSYIPYSWDLVSLDNGQIAVSVQGPEVPYGTAVSRVVTFNVGEVVTGHDYGETLTGGRGPDVISGLGGDDILNGNGGSDQLDGGSGNDILFGAAGNDVLTGGLGADRMYGGTGDDTFIVDNAGDVVVEYTGEGIDGVRASISYSLTANVENLTLTGSADLNGTGNNLANTIIGNEGANTLSGGYGSDVLIGNAGNDTLDGGVGADRMEGGTGNDTYVVDNAGDVVVEYNGQGVDSVIASVSFALSDNVENLTLTGSALKATGNALDNVLTGNDVANQLFGGAGNDTLDGRGGADRMDGGAGNDTYIVDNAGDTVIEYFDGGNADKVIASVSYTLSANVETLVLAAGAGSIDGTGNAQANTLVGNEGANVLSGGLGPDTMTGGQGADTFLFANKPSSFNNVDTILDFVAGTDRIALDDAIFTALVPGSLPDNAFVVGTRASTPDQHVIFDAQTGALHYDADGSGAGRAVQFATLANFAGQTLTAGDFLIV